MAAHLSLHLGKAEGKAMENSCNASSGLDQESLPQKNNLEERSRMTPISASGFHMHMHTHMCPHTCEHTHAHTTNIWIPLYLLKTPSYSSQTRVVSKGHWTTVMKCCVWKGFQSLFSPILCWELILSLIATM